MAVLTRYEYFLMCLSIMILHLAGTSAKDCESKRSCYARLRNQILERHAVVHKIPPNIEDGFKTPLPMSFQFYILSVSSMEELRQVIIVDSYIEMRWVQTDLAWNSSEFGGLDWVYISSDKIWVPDIMIVMGHVPTFILGLPETMQLYSNGTVVSNNLNSLSFYCNIDFQRYPFDMQECSVGFLVVGNDIRQEIAITDFVFYPMLSLIEITGEWVFVNRTHEIIHTGDDGPDFPRYTFSVRRQSTYYVITVIFPMVLTSAMIPLVFLIPANTGEKMSYLTAIFTSTAVFLNYISDVMPRSLSSMPYLAILLIEVLTEGLLAMLASLVVVNLFRHEEKVVKLDYSRKGQVFKYAISPQKFPDELQEPYSKKCRIYISKITSRQLDWIFFSIFSIGQTIIVIVIFCYSDWL